MSNDHATILRVLGGKAHVARFLGIDPNVLTKWHVRGIPAKYWPVLATMDEARDRGITVERLAGMSSETAA